MPADEKHLSALDALLEEPGATVTYKFLARHLDISANLAKKLLFAHVSRSSGASVATHVVSGWVKSGDVRAHVVRLARGVDGEVEAARKAMDEVTGEHVYSVSKASSDHPALTAVPASSVKQTDELFDAPPETPNALRDNRHSAVACARWSSAPRVPRGGSPRSPRRPRHLRLRQVGLRASRPNRRRPRRRVPARSPGSSPSQSRTSSPSRGPRRPSPRPSQPAAAGVRMAAMFAKAPPKKAAAPAPPPPAPKEDEDMSDEDGEDDEEEEVMEVPRHRRRVLMEDSDDDDVEPAEGGARARARARAREEDEGGQAQVHRTRRRRGTLEG